mmetsp:Transcript_60671/g.179928  ORF Transcript_60671/g.179928 Transcript_60671/m.179928 type:complete len:243 (+) Transcript_60671:224-952(+)
MGPGSFCRFVLVMNELIKSRIGSHLLSTEDIHDGDGSGDGLEGKQRGHGDHGGPSVLKLDDLVPGLLLLGQLGLESPDIESHVTGSLGSHAAEVIPGVTNTLPLGDGNEEQDSGEPRGLLGLEDPEGLGPVGFDGEAGKVHPQAESSDVRRPDSGPREHRHAAMLDLGLLEELSPGEHVGEGVGGVLEIVQAEGIPLLSPDLSVEAVVGAREGRLGDAIGGGRGEGGGAREEERESGGDLHR